MLLKDKVVLVTGGARAVGAGIVRSLAREGAAVAINCFNSLDEANELAGSIRARGTEAGVWQCDAREFEDTRRMVDEIVEKYGRIDAVVNNATSGSKVGEWDPEHWQNYINCYEGEVKFVISTLYAAWPHMKAQGGGRIVNIITEQWNEGSSGYVTHVAAKAAVVGATRWLVPRLAPDNIPSTWSPLAGLEPREPTTATHPTTHMSLQPRSDESPRPKMSETPACSSSVILASISAVTTSR